MMFNQGNLSFRLATNKADYKLVYDLRKEVFGKEQNYSEQCLQLHMKKNEYYILAFENDSAVATLTLEIGTQPGHLDIDHYSNTDSLYKEHNKIAFWSRNAVLKNYRGSLITPLIHEYMYNLIKTLGANYIIVDCKKNNIASRKFIPKLGYAPIDKCTKGEIGEVIIWGITLQNYQETFPLYLKKKKLHENYTENSDICAAN